MSTLELVPVPFADACEFVSALHRHHRPPVGHKFSIGAADGDTLVGVVMVGRPVARSYDDGQTLEVTRSCTDGTEHVNSMLYGAAWRAAKALGYRRLITYTAGRRERFLAARRRLAGGGEPTGPQGVGHTEPTARRQRQRRRGTHPLGSLVTRSWLLVVPMRPTLTNAVHNMHYRKASADRKLWRQAGQAAAVKAAIPELASMQVTCWGVYPGGKLPDPDAGR